MADLTKPRSVQRYAATGARPDATAPPSPAKRLAKQMSGLVAKVTKGIHVGMPTIIAMPKATPPGAGRSLRPMAYVHLERAYTNAERRLPEPGPRSSAKVLPGLAAGEHGGAEAAAAAAAAAFSSVKKRRSSSLMGVRATRRGSRHPTIARRSSKAVNAADGSRASVVRHAGAVGRASLALRSTTPPGEGEMQRDYNELTPRTLFDAFKEAPCSARRGSVDGLLNPGTAFADPSVAAAEMSACSAGVTDHAALMARATAEAEAREEQAQARAAAAERMGLRAPQNPTVATAAAFGRRQSFVGVNWSALEQRRVLKKETRRIGPHDAELVRYSRFRSTHLEAAFAGYRLDKTHAHICALLLMGSTIVLLYQLVVFAHGPDSFVYDEPPAFRYGVRLLVPITTLAFAGTTLRRPRRFARWLRPAVVVGAMLLYTAMPLKVLLKERREDAELAREYIYGALACCLITSLLAFFCSLGLQLLGPLLLFQHAAFNVTLLWLRPVRAGHLFLGAPLNFSLNALMICASAIFLLGAALNETMLREIFVGELHLVGERDCAENLLTNVMPSAVAQQLQTLASAHELAIQDLGKRRLLELAAAHPEVTVLFADLAGFTAFSSSVSAAVLVDVLNTIFSTFDVLAECTGVEKVKTIGDCYMVAGGVPVATPEHAMRAVRFGLAALYWMDKFLLWQDLPVSTPKIKLRVGLHSGSVVGGVIGLKKWTFDIWGNTVNLASRMESNGEIGEMCMSSTTHALVRQHFESNSFVERAARQFKGVAEPVVSFLLRPSRAEEEALLTGLLDIRAGNAIRQAVQHTSDHQEQATGGDEGGEGSGSGEVRGFEQHVSLKVSKKRNRSTSTLARTSAPPLQEMVTGQANSIQNERIRSTPPSMLSRKLPTLKVTAASLFSA